MLLIVFMILFLVMEVEVFCGCYVLEVVIVVAWITAGVFCGAVAFGLMFCRVLWARGWYSGDFYECSEGFEIAYG